MVYSENITFECNGETIAATIDWNASKDKPTLISLHGGGSGNREKAGVLTTRFAAEAGISCIRIDHSGWGESTGTQKECSLKKRVKEAIAASELMDTDKPLIVMGSSMGGPVAMELTRHLNVGTALLFCPALYAAEAYALPFDERFTTILRRENSFLDTDSALLENYKGKFLHIISEEDKIIPKGVTELYEHHVVNAVKREFKRLPGSEHQLYGLFAKDQETQDKVFTELVEFIAA